MSFFYGIKTATLILREEIIVIDAGHGGIDGGVSGTITKAKESDLNLKYAISLKNVFEKQGYRIVLTRSTEDGLYGTAAAYLNEDSRKSQDMKRRKEIINQAEPVCVLSVHMNFFGKSSARGAQVFYNSSNPESKRLATAVQNKINNLNEEYVGRKITQLPGDYYIVKSIEYPSCIVECGFLSNPEDEKLLLNADYRERLVYEIGNGVLMYLKTRELQS
jgi:N-acetylmuramoyl-L-alanine amidase